MQNLKVKMLSVAIAALTAATPILSSYVAYATDCSAQINLAGSQKRTG